MLPTKYAKMVRTPDNEKRNLRRMREKGIELGKEDRDLIEEPLITNIPNKKNSKAISAQLPKIKKSKTGEYKIVVPIFKSRRK